MQRSGLLSILSLSWLLPCCLAIPQSSVSVTPSFPSTDATPPAPSLSLNQITNLSNPYRYYVPDTTVALDFYEYRAMGAIPRQDVLMCVVEALSKIFGHNFNEPVPRLSTFYYKRQSFIHIQDYNPTPGRAHTYGDMAATLRGIGEWMTEENYFRALEFQIWSMTTAGTIKIGSGGVGGPMAAELNETGIELNVS